MYLHSNMLISIKRLLITCQDTGCTEQDIRPKQRNESIPSESSSQEKNEYVNKS